MSDTPIVAYHPVEGLLIYNWENKEWQYIDGSAYGADLPFGAKFLVVLPTYHQIVDAIQGASVDIDPMDAGAATEAVFVILKEGHTDAG